MNNGTDGDVGGECYDWDCMAAANHVLGVVDAYGSILEVVRCKFTPSDPLYVLGAFA